MIIERKKIHLQCLNEKSNMKNKIIEALKTRFPGVDEKTIGRISDKLAEKTSNTTTDEEIKKLADEVTFQQVMDSYADFRVSGASATAKENAIKEYEKKHGLKDGKKVESAGGQPETKKKDEGNGGGNPDDEWRKQLMEEVKSLKNQLEKNDAEKTKAARTSRFNEAIKDLPQSFKSKFQKDFSRMNFENDEDFEKYVGEELKGDIESITKEIKINGATFGTPKGGSGGGNGEIPDALKARAAALKKQYEAGK